MIYGRIIIPVIYPNVYRNYSYCFVCFGPLSRSASRHSSRSSHPPPTPCPLFWRVFFELRRLSVESDCFHFDLLVVCPPICLYVMRVLWFIRWLFSKVIMAGEKEHAHTIKLINIAVWALIVWKTSAGWHLSVCVCACWHFRKRFEFRCDNSSDHRAGSGESSIYVYPIRVEKLPINGINFRLERRFLPVCIDMARISCVCAPWSAF